ncbi:hypothetical protein [Oricola sp.]|uniref:hypothetical protein n=1 Tax=Oricola sp. TaxID=1979950 RepID=UPI0025E65CED|nr:hypothetical protein [Oricola sp.]MCI5075445.1 hypothetical protein [Oricola sp.]
MLLSALTSLTLEYGRPIDGRVFALLAVYFAGGFAGCLLAWPFILWVRNRSSLTVSIVFAAFALTGFTLASTAAVLALDYRAYYAQWHSEVLSKVWLYQQVFTALGSTYQFAVIGIRLYWPLGVVALVPASWWLARRTS